VETPPEKQTRSEPAVPGPLPLKVGLTGNIGSGKSTAARLFSELGVPTFDADKVGHELLEQDDNIRQKVVGIFGGGIMANGVISRERLGKLVFSNDEKRKKLEGILHPAIISAIILRLSREVAGGYAVIEVPLLYEAELSGYFDYVILVKSAKKNALDRAAAKLGLSKNDVLKRMNAQIPQSEKEKIADFSISNDGTPEDLRKKVEILHSIISSLASSRSPRND
jgi:dephospho-CoA kinase